MKKLAAILCSVFMLFSLAACSGNSESNTTENNDNIVETSEENAPINMEEESEPINETEETKVLVAYFSATNTTAGIAEYIANELSADIYEIVPEQPYTEEDLNYNDNSTRATVEMNDETVRPAISSSVENMEQYDIVFIGYPIWWGQAPRIMSTFVESYDFSDKIVIPFCTSGSSGIGSSATNLQSLTDNAEWISGQRFSGTASRDKVIEWVNGLGLDIAE